VTLAEEFLPDFDGKVTVFMVEVISQNQDERFGWVKVFRLKKTGVRLEVDARFITDFSFIRHWSGRIF